MAVHWLGPDLEAAESLPYPHHFDLMVIVSRSGSWAGPSPCFGCLGPEGWKLSPGAWLPQWWLRGIWEISMVPPQPGRSTGGKTQTGCWVNALGQGNWPAGTPPLSQDRGPQMSLGTLPVFVRTQNNILFWWGLQDHCNLSVISTQEQGIWHKEVCIDYVPRPLSSKSAAERDFRGVQGFGHEPCNKPFSAPRVWRFWALFASLCIGLM